MNLLLCLIVTAPLACTNSVAPQSELAPAPAPIQGSYPMMMGREVVTITFFESKLTLRRISLDERKPAHLDVIPFSARYMWGAVPLDSRSAAILFEYSDSWFSIERIELGDNEEIAISQEWRGRLDGSPYGLATDSNSYILYGRGRVYRVDPRRGLCEVKTVRRHDADAGSIGLGDGHLIVRDYPSALLIQWPEAGCRVGRVTPYSADGRVGLVGALGDLSISVALKEQASATLRVFTSDGVPLRALELPSGNWSWLAAVGQMLVLYDFAGMECFVIDGSGTIRIHAKPAGTHVVRTTQSELLFATESDLFRSDATDGR